MRSWVSRSRIYGAGLGMWSARASSCCAGACSSFGGQAWNADEAATRSRFDCVCMLARARNLDGDRMSC